MTRPESIWAWRLAIVLLWAVVSAIALGASLAYGTARWGAWAWAASFVMCALVAAYSFWRLS
jgi:hypothetical protein